MLTLPLAGRTVPGLGFCETTRPLLILEEARRIVPTRQWARPIARFAAGSDFFVTFGTLQETVVLTRTETVFAPSAVARSGLPSPFRSPNAMPRG